jgi:hypothetical protein
MVRRVLVFSDMEFDAALGDGLRGGRAQVYGVRVRRRRAGGGVLEPQGFQGGAGGGRAEGRGARQRVLQEPAQAVPQQRWRHLPEGRHGEGDRREGV